MKLTAPSSSLVVSIVALVVAGAGGGYAATTQLITGKQIKDGTVSKADLTPSLRQQINTRPLRGLPGLTGLPGLPGVPGPAGAPGAAGGFDPAKASYVVGPSTTLSPGQSATVQALCPADTRAIGGGFYSIGHVDVNTPIVNGSGWQAVIFNDTSIVTTVNAAFAVCAAR